MSQEKLEFNENNVRNEIEKIRPMLQNDGGDIDFIGLEDNIVKVRLTGACAGCAFAALTLQHGVEKTLKKVFPELESVKNLN